jgi:hypothetical protein
MTTLVQDNFGVTVTANLYEKDSDPVAYVNLTTATGVRFLMRKDDDKKLTVNGAGFVTSAVSGGVGYTFERDELDEPGDYLAFWEVTFPDRVQSTSEGDLITVRRR